MGSAHVGCCRWRAIGVFLPVVLALPVGCRRHTLTADAVVGSYRLAGRADDKLALHRNFTYIHSSTEPEGQPVEQTGRWSLEPADANGDQRVTCEGFIFFGKEPRRGLWSGVIERSGSDIRIVVSYDRNLYYERTGP